MKKIGPKPLKLRAIPLALCLLVSLLTSSLAPFLQSAFAAGPISPNIPSNINLIQRTNPKNPIDFVNDLNLTVGTCMGSFETPPPTKTGSLMAAQFGSNPDINTLATKSASQLANTEVTSYLGAFIPGNSASDLSVNQMQFLAAGVGTTNVPIIKFTPGSPDQGVVNGDYKAATSSGSNVVNGFCSQLIMLPVSQTEWRGFNVSACTTTDQNTQICSDSGTYLDFKLTSTSGNQTLGTLSYAAYFNSDPSACGNSAFTQGNVSCHIHTQTATIDIGGTADFTGSGGTGTVGGIVTASWINVSKITLTSGPYAGEVYVKPAWNTSQDTTGGNANHSYYFLSSVPAAEQTTRGGLTLGSAPLCEDSPILPTCSTGSSNCVPFISSNDPINISGGAGATMQVGVSSLAANIPKLGGSSMKFYDYTTSCKQTTISPVTPSDPGTASTIWLFYSSKTDAFETIFSNGDANEWRYIGQYTENPQGAYSGGQNSCDGVINASPPKGIAEQTTFAVTWNLYDNKCANNTKFGQLNVLAIADQTGFDGAAAAVPQTPADTTPPKLCESLGDFGPSFIVCPIIDGAEALVALLDNAINSLLTINTDQIFGTNKTSTAYHKAWASSRTIALSIIAIASLVMVIAQALGVEILDAYTVRKVLPKILIASIGITLSWPLLKFAITLSNDAGNGIRNVIYGPFSSLGTVSNGMSLGGGSSTVLALIGTGGILAFGWLGLLSFLLTALMAALVGFGVMAFRVILTVFLVIVAPFAIGCYALPNTRKGWVIWRDAEFGVLLVFVIISGMIATGRVFAITSFAVGGTFNQIIGVIAYFLPYFLITKAFSWAGGVVSTVGGFVNDRSRGAFDRLKKFRSQRPTKRYNAFKQGELWHGERSGPLGAIARSGNALGRRTGMGVRGNFGVGARGEAAMATRETAAIAETLRNNPALAELANNDDANGVLALSGGTTAGMQAAARDLFVDKNGGYDAVRGEQAMNAAAYFLRQDGRKNATAAVQTFSHNKSRPVGAGRIDIVQRGIDRLAGSNDAQRRGLSYMYEYESRSSGGRADLGGDWMNDRIKTDAQNEQLIEAQRPGSTAESQQAVKQQTISDLTMMDGVGRTEVPTLVRGHTNQVTQLVGNNTGQQGTLERMLGSNNPEHRLEAATTVLELQRSLSYANKDSATLINQFFQRNSINQTSGQLENQLVDIANGQPLGRAPIPPGNPGSGATSVAALSARARVYDQPTGGVLGATPGTPTGFTPGG